MRHKKNEELNELLKECLIELVNEKKMFGYVSLGDKDKFTILLFRIINDLLCGK